VAVVGSFEGNDEDCVELLELGAAEGGVIPPVAAVEFVLGPTLLVLLSLLVGACDGLVVVGVFVAAIVPEYNLAFQYPTAAKGCLLPLI